MEFEDSRWLPAFLRNAMTGILGLAESTAGIYLPVAGAVAAECKTGEKFSVTDMCTGSGRGTLTVLRELKKMGLKPAAVLTDLFPNTEAAEKINQEEKDIRYILAPIDALSAPHLHPADWFTIFAGFHHFNQEEKVELVLRCTTGNSKLLIVEGVKPGLLTWVIAAIFLPFLTWALLPFVKPFDWKWIPFTYLLPVIPFLVWWDGLMSLASIQSSADLKNEISPVLKGLSTRVGSKKILPGISVHWLLISPESKKPVDESTGLSHPRC